MFGFHVFGIWYLGFGRWVQGVGFRCGLDREGHDRDGHEQLSQEGSSHVGTCRSRVYPHYILLA